MIIEAQNNLNKKRKINNEMMPIFYKTNLLDQTNFNESIF